MHIASRCVVALSATLSAVEVQALGPSSKGGFTTPVRPRIRLVPRCPGTAGPGAVSGSRDNATDATAREWWRDAGSTPA
ncbi:MAG: hypothetical protein SF053_10235, partial [Bacteroidia bacterium]|nr:hypothetical protein [Bacteroidia bacterium]